MGNLTLSGLKRRHGGSRERALQSRGGTMLCFIWSGQWGQFWGPERRGYTPYRPGEADPEKFRLAGVYKYAEALEATWHCGPEKRISFEFIKDKALLQKLESEAG